jgi:hypothetical protein
MNACKYDPAYIPNYEERFNDAAVRRRFGHPGTIPRKSVRTVISNIHIIIVV